MKKPVELGSTSVVTAKAGDHTLPETLPETATTVADAVPLSVIVPSRVQPPSSEVMSQKACPGEVALGARVGVCGVAWCVWVARACDVCVMCAVVVIVPSRVQPLSSDREVAFFVCVRSE